MDVIRGSRHELASEVTLMCSEGSSVAQGASIRGQRPLDSLLRGSRLEGPFVTGFASTATAGWAAVSFDFTTIWGGGSVAGAHIGHCTSGSGGRSVCWQLVFGIDSGRAQVLLVSHTKKLFSVNHNIYVTVNFNQPYLRL